MNSKVFEGIKRRWDSGLGNSRAAGLKYLADYGATVIVLESPKHPDLLRTSTPYKDFIP